MVSVFGENARPGVSTHSPDASGSTSSASKTSGPSRIRRRNRLITSCLECRRRKLKCDKSHPCTNCTKRVRDCVYLALALDSASQNRLTVIKDQMGALERTLEKDAARRGSVSDRRSSFDALAAADEEDEDELEEAEDEKHLRATPGYLDAAYDEDADDELMDLGFMMGKVRITERIGGYVHPRLVEEINNHLEYASKSPTSAHPPSTASHDASYSKPGLEYIVPTSSFFFAPHPPRSNVIDFLPSKLAADRLMAQYWDAVHCLARIVHRPSFQRQYDYFWQSFASGFEPPPSQQAAVFAAMFSSAMSMSDDDVMQGFGVSKLSLVNNLRLGTETALSNANFLKTTKLETLQALVMYLLPQCRGEVSRAHSALTGTAIRLAECMGLHRDGTHYGLSPVEIHVRRLIWYQLCFLDVRTCEATGPRPQIAAEHFDTQLPLNVNDTDLESPFFKGEDSPRWTDITLTRIRFECNRIHRLIWVERPRVDARQMTLTALLSKAEQFRRDMERKYTGMFDETVPIQHFAKLLMSSLIVKAHIMILSRYRRSDSAPSYPERLRQLTLSAAIVQVESSVALETTPSFKLWWWYTGAFQQYHTAILLLMELYEDPDMREADRIWACLDYVFETAPSMSGREKARTLLVELSDRSRIYNSRRKLKAPVRDEHEQRRFSTETEQARQAKMPPPPEAPRRLSAPSSQMLQPRFVAAEQPSQESQSMFGLHTTPRRTPGSMPRSDQNFTIVRDPLERSSSTSSKPSFSMPLQTYFPYNLPSLNSSSSQYTSAPLQFTPQAPASASMNQGSGTGNINDVMADIDWNEWDELFPADARALSLNVPVPGFGFAADAEGGKKGGE